MSTQQILKDLEERKKPREIPKDSGVISECLMSKVTDEFLLNPGDLISRKRDAKTALARQTAMYLIRQETDCTLAEIGQMLGGRTPATVSFGYQKIASDMNGSSRLKRLVAKCLEI